MTMTEKISLAPYTAALDRIPPFRWTGQVTEVVGLLIESRGPRVAIGDFCEVTTSNGRPIRTQVIGFRDGRVLAMPLEEVDGLQLGDQVSARSDDARVEVGPGLLGRVLDGFGKPMDGGPPIEARDTYSLYGTPTNPLDREHITQPLSPESGRSTASCPAEKASASGFLAAAVSARARCSAPCRGTTRPT
jgi:flagellar biosynthesis/type III secretory pathway ATPase